MATVLLGSVPMSTSDALPHSKSPRSVSTTFPIGTFVDARYEILRPIARGGMGEIVEARHTQTGRLVVLKLLRRELMGRTDVLARLRREAKALGAIQHPGVITIFDAGFCEKNGPFLVLEKLDGRALDGLLTARGSLGVDAAMTIFRALATALSEVHRQGYVHRDMKPSNVFIASSRVGGEAVKLLDFGVVGELTHGTDKRLTLVGDLLGTLGYMAPEQMADITLADPRSDLYALAVVVLECLGVGLDRVSQVRRAPRPATALLTERKDVPRQAVQLLDDMLAMNPGERPSSADAVVARLDGLGHPPTQVLGYMPPAGIRESPTQCEPASLRAKPAPVEARRKQLRAPYITPVRIIGANEQIDGRTEDISASGLLVVARGELKLEGPVIVRFALPTTGRVVAVQASPKWAREQSGRTAIGLEFLNLDPVAAEAIQSYVRFVAVER